MGCPLIGVGRGEYGVMNDLFKLSAAAADRLQLFQLWMNKLSPDYRWRWRDDELRAARTVATAASCAYQYFYQLIIGTEISLQPRTVGACFVDISIIIFPLFFDLRVRRCSFYVLPFYLSTFGISLLFLRRAIVAQIFHYWQLVECSVCCAFLALRLLVLISPLLSFSFCALLCRLRCDWRHNRNRNNN